MKQEVRCILCPSGCTLTVAETESGVVISGARCPRGEEFGENEIRDPRRPLTTAVKVRGGELPVVPVRTDGQVPREKMKDLVLKLKDVVVKAPVRIGEVIIADCCGTGVNVVASRSLRERES